jgi:hypothetical protein
MPEPATRAREKDLLGRRALADALAGKLYDHAIGPHDLDPGPTVVTIEGPWGSGKSTLLDLVRERLPDPPRSDVAAPRLTVREASQLLRDAPPVPTVTPPLVHPRGVVTAWFNPWAHQSGEQVWAGLVAEIIEAAQPVLYPTESARERYWLARNLTRVDRYALRRTLHRRTLSPELTLGALGVVASLAIAIAEIETTVRVLGVHVQTAIVALVIAVTFLVLGGVHTAWRFLRAPAARFLPGELFYGPVNASIAEDVATTPEGMSDPLRRARAGSLYLHQHHVSELVADLDRAGYELVVFVDDLDRCRALTTAEVFEAINLFLAGFVTERRGTGRENPGDPGSSLRARFVIGLDPVVVAGHLDRVYADLYDPDTALDGEDPSPGWAFLRKLVHLPVLVPQVSDSEMFRIVDQIAGVSEEPARIPRQRSDDEAPAGAAWRLPRHPSIQALVRERLSAQPDRSIREAMRQLNLWEFYERVLALTDPTPSPELGLERSRNLVILAEIVTRWPALQRFLHRSYGDHGEQTGLQRIAAGADDDERWPGVAHEVLGGRGGYDEALDTLRDLLRRYDGRGVADLATQLL